MRYLQRGITVHDPAKAAAGYTLFSPLLQNKVYLIDMAGEVVHQWDLPGQPGNYGYLQPNGNLLIATWAGGGPDGLAARGGLIQEYDWDGNPVWEHRDENQHHDFRRCPNGNVVYLSLELMPDEAAARVQGGAAGSEHKDGGIWGDYVCEVNASGEQVWDWRIWEHLEVENHPMSHTRERHEFGHANTIVPIGDDHIGICCRYLDWVGVIDRATGDLTYQRHEPDWGGPHDFQPLDNGNYMVFANRYGQLPRGSKIVEWNPESNETVWEYWGNPTHTFDSHYISGCQRLWNGNTLICEGLWGRIFEVTPDGEIVWEYISPFTSHREKGPTAGDQSTVFRAYRYAADGPELQGRV
ncbi:MAG: aryl-sulfate sulfotransferase [Alphaproteobacteria bacterium]